MEDDELNALRAFVARKVVEGFDARSGCIGMRITEEAR